MSTKKKKGASSPTSPELDARVRRSKETVLAVTHQMMSETGLSGVSIDEVSKRSGVAKTTIYRHWPSRADLLLEACSKLGSKFEVPDTGSFRGDIEALVRALASYLRTAPATKILPSIVDAAEHDTKIAKLLHAQVHAYIMAPLYEVIERAQKKGEIGRDQAASHLIARIVGPLFFRRWFSGESLDENFVRAIVQSAIVAVDTDTRRR
ncbi:MAG: TetR-family transcriptional regulator [Bradyrhizobium sp.]|nr:TetR-family transcriptional regulator [Bradyrhizobium sp.]